MIPAFLAPRQEAFDHVLDARAAPADVGKALAFLGAQVADDVVADLVDGGVEVLMLGRSVSIQAGADEVDLGAEDVAFLMMSAGLAELDVAHDGRIAANELAELGDALVYISGDCGSQSDIRAFDAGVHDEKRLRC